MRVGPRLVGRGPIWWCVQWWFFYRRWVGSWVENRERNEREKRESERESEIESEREGAVYRLSKRQRKRLQPRRAIGGLARE